ncbi:4644_t:CDS:2 [Scutellospora calospora]|uniref:4644_t:CDS:1 n=1 Tax=Scutellospora calospora TaxID=85575 RepID=A0ACA9L430_9GLOM|nr:4644_t:CDS:2 [Scutellospora calospora]
MTLFNFSSVLKTLINKAIKKAQENPIKKVYFVLGNESADLDSIVSSTSYAYLNAKFCPLDTVYLPIIQIPRSDFSLRPECDYVFKKCEISTSSLIFLDDISSHLSTVSTSFNLGLVLLDHNKLIGIWKQFEDKVNTILDHHQDEGLYMNIKERCIEGVGSTTSLVVLKFKEILKKKFNDNENLIKINNDTRNFNKIIANFLLSPILIDTILLDSSYGRTTQKDQEATDFLLDIISPPNHYKEYNLELEMGNETKKCVMGISSVVWTLKDWVLREGGIENFMESVKKFTLEKNLDLEIIMLAFDYKGDVGFKREIVVYSKKGPFCQKEILEKFEEIIGLKEIKNFENGKGNGEEKDVVIKFYEQKNIAMSRKKVYPVIKDLVSAKY